MHDSDHLHFVGRFRGGLAAYDLLDQFRDLPAIGLRGMKMHVFQSCIVQDGIHVFFAEMPVPGKQGRMEPDTRKPAFLFRIGIAVVEPAHIYQQGIIFF